MNADNADTMPPAADIAGELERVEEMSRREFKKFLRPSPYARRIKLHWEEILATQALHTAIRQATFTDEEFAEYETLSGRVFCELNAPDRERFRSLDTRTRVMPFFLRKLRTAFLCADSPGEIRKLTEEILNEVEGWDGEHTAHLTRALAAIGKLASECTLRGRSSDNVRERLKKIIALEIEPEEAALRGPEKLESFRLDQLNSVYSAEEAALRETYRHRDAARKLVERERDRAGQLESPDTSS